MKEITIESVTYKSLTAAWEALAPPSVSFALARKRLNRGWIPRLAFVILPIKPEDRRRSTILTEVQLKKTGFEL